MHACGQNCLRDIGTRGVDKDKRRENNPLSVGHIIMVLVCVQFSSNTRGENAHFDLKGWKRGEGPVGVPCRQNRQGGYQESMSQLTGESEFISQPIKSFQFMNYYADI